MTAPRGVPFRPDHGALAAEQRRSMRRAIAALTLTATSSERIDPEDFLRRHWGEDSLAGRLLRAASSPAMTTTSGLPAISPITAFRALAPSSSALKLFERGTIVDLNSFTTLRVPYVTTVPAGAWVAEASPAPALDLALASAVVGPMRKLVVLAGITEELEEASSPDLASDVIGKILSDATMKTFDAAVFGSAVGDVNEPQGLLYGVTPLTAAPVGAGAMAADLAALAQSIAAAWIDTEGLIYVAAVREATVIKASVSPKFDNLVLASPVLAPGTVAAFAPGGVISAYNDLPSVETSKHAVVNFNTAPVSDGSLGPGTFSAWQQRMIAVRVSCRAAWTAIPGAVATVNNVNW
jgi:hypothetical protein